MPNRRAQGKTLNLVPRLINCLGMLALTKPEKKILIAVISILIGLCTMAYFAHRKSRLLISSAEAIEQSEEIKYHIKEVLFVSLEMETGVRGYVITGDEMYLKPTNKAMVDVFLHIQELSASPGITEEQQNKIKQLTQLADEKSDVTTRTIELRRQKGMTDAVAFILEGKGKDLMNQIRDIAEKMLSDENLRLTERKAQNRKVLSHFAVTFYLLQVKISITVITVLTLLVLYIRNRNKAERSLKESQALFHNVLDHTSSIISIKDISGRFILVNQAFQNLFNINEDNIRGKTVSDLFDKPIAEAIRHTDYDVIRKQQQRKVDEIIPVNNRIHHFEALKFPLFDINHIPYALCSIATDETEKKNLDRQHHAEMNRVLDLFNNAPCGYQATNQDGIIIEINTTLLKWLGYTREEVIGRMPVKSLLSSESVEQFSYYFPRIRSGEIKSIFDLESTYIRKDGSRLPIVINSIAQYDEEGKFLYTRTSIFDVSYRKQVEELMTHN